MVYGMAPLSIIFSEFEDPFAFNSHMLGSVTYIVCDTFRPYT